MKENFSENECFLRNFEFKGVFERIRFNVGISLCVEEVLGKTDFSLKKLEDSKRASKGEFEIISNLSQKFLGLWPKPLPVLELFQKDIYQDLICLALN